MIFVNADDFITSLRKRQWAHELVNGEVVAVPRSPRKRRRTGVRGFDIGFLLYEHYLSDHPVGKLLENPPYFMLSEMLPTLRRPDLAFVSAHRLAEFDFTKPVVKTVPDLAIEIVFDPINWHYKHDRLRDFLHHGTPMAWVIDVATEWVAVYRGTERPELYRNNDKLPGGSVLPRLSLPVYELFE
jgi:Uma2 family endonuclease